MVVAQITTDNREAFRCYDETMPRFGTAPAALFEGLMARDDTELHVIGCTQRPMRSPEKLDERTWFHSLHVPKWGWMRGGYAGCVFAVRDCLGRIRPDIVHGQGTERECGLSAVFSGLPNVITIHGNMGRVARQYRSRVGSYHWLAAKLEGIALRRAGGVFCNTGYTEAAVVGRGSPRWRVPNAVRKMFFEGPLDQNGRREGVPVLVNAGVIIPLKRQVELLELGLRLQAAGARFRLRFAGHFGGDEAYNRRFRALIAASKGIAVHDGVLGAGEMRDWLDAADAMVHVSAEESFGLAPAEALARNLKVFAFGVGGVPDVLAGMEGAESVPDREWGGLEDRLRRWLEAGAPRPTSATLTAKRRFHPEVVASRHLEIYREVLTVAR